MSLRKYFPEINDMIHFIHPVFMYISFDEDWGFAPFVQNQALANIHACSHGIHDQVHHTFALAG